MHSFFFPHRKQIIFLNVRFDLADLLHKLMISYRLLLHHIYWYIARLVQRMKFYRFLWLCCCYAIPDLICLHLYWRSLRFVQWISEYIFGRWLFMRKVQSPDLCLLFIICQRVLKVSACFIETGWTTIVLCKLMAIL